MAEGGGPEPGEQERRSSGPRPPSARDLQLALAELYEDEVKCKSSKSNRPKATVFKSPRTPPQRHLQVEDTDWVVLFVSGLNISMEKISCKMFRFCLNCGAMVSV
ncbi:UBXN2B isoform 3 [Pan troglodytes]|uniref:UBX domain protein 2B n=5 Tax=Hominidae TaxID=9604 RepID=E5RGJ4_HUMAN|nr:UBX domain protein 2B [Homo sapiens]KAI4010721.1 UBX domain protein 2B [Homo sapiens]PNI34478.1 UBXN2B isoform 3 [Pan troglodytes]PNJ47638.1 UBXN2B isoform 3 [Pongo abelii]